MEQLAAGLADDYRQLDLDPADRVMLDFAVKLTRFPDQMVKNDVILLRQASFDDVAIHDIVEVVDIEELGGSIISPNADSMVSHPSVAVV